MSLTFRCTAFAGVIVASLVLVGCPQSTLQVPNVAGETQANAQTTIVAAGLAVGTVTQQSSATVPAGSVISQIPTAGTSVAPGTAVNLVVSNGPQSVAVPNVVGMVQAAAQTTLTNAGLTVGTVSQQSNETVPAGCVISQDPAAASSVVTGTAVSLVVSEGAPLTVPNVVPFRPNSVGRTRAYHK